MNGENNQEEAKIFNVPTVVSITNGYGHYEVSANHSDCDLSEMLDLMRRVLLAAGFYVKELTEADDGV